MSDDVYGMYMRGRDLLRGGNVHAAATVLERAVELEPDRASLRETLARAYYDAGRYDRALDQFERTIALDPADDYAYFGAGLSLGRLGRADESIGQLRLAVTMRPESSDYQRALQRALADKERE